MDTAQGNLATCLCPMQRRLNRDCTDGIAIFLHPNFYNALSSTAIGGADFLYTLEV